MNEIIIKDKKIGKDNPTYFIADIAANHDGDLERAKYLCLLAKESAADAVKFQHFNAKNFVSDRGFKSIGGKKSHQSKWGKSVYEIYQNASLPLFWTKELKEYCDEIGITFFSAPYGLDMVEHLNDYVPAWKIGSGDINYHKQLEVVAKTKKPVMVATGASTIEEVTSAIEILESYDVDIILMQCNTNYTAEDKNYKYLNLNVLKTYSVMYPNVELGLSDHTFGDETVLGAVTLGARYIEKHFTDDNSRIGPDHPFSMNPTTWKNMVDRTRRLEAALGLSVKKVEDNEKETVVLQRRSIRLKNNLKKGNIITESDICYIRPCPQDSLPIHINPVGKTLTRDLSINDYLKFNDLQ